MLNVATTLTTLCKNKFTLSSVEKGVQLPDNAVVDSIDAVILKMLLQESRTSFTKIAKECKISVATARMRYKRLWKAGIINGETMLVNPLGLGYSHIGVIGTITTRENEDKAIEILKNRTHAKFVFKHFGKYDLGIQVALHNIEQINEIQRDLEANPAIRRADALIFVDTLIVEHPENLVIKPFIGKIDYKPIAAKQTGRQIDETDRKIARILTQKSRTSFRKIAKELCISTKNVIERYKKLRGTVLTLSTITVDLNKLGYSAGAFLFIKLANKSKISEVVTELLKTPNLIALVKYIGPYDLFAHVVFADFQEYFRMEENISRMKNIDQLDIFLIPSHPVWPPNFYANLL